MADNRQKRLLLLNGNGSEDLTKHMERVAHQILPDGVVLEAATVRDAPKFVANRIQATHAASAILTQVINRFDCPPDERPDGVMLCCYGEPGMLALREVIDAPVTGMLEASSLCAMQLGHRFEILAAGADWYDQIEDLLKVYGISERCSGIHILSREAAHADEQVWLPAMQADFDALAENTRADVVVIGGGFTAGKAKHLQPSAGIKIVDCFQATLMQTIALMNS